MKQLKNILAIILFIFTFPLLGVSMSSRPVQQPIPAPAPIAPPPVPNAPPVAPAPMPAPAPAPQQAALTSFKDYITALRTEWKQADVINAQGAFTPKFITFVSSANLDPLFTKTLFEAGKNLYLPLTDNMIQNKQSIQVADAAIQHNFLDKKYPFYDSKTKLFKQNHIDEAVRGFAATNPNPLSFDSFTDSMLRRLHDHWDAIGEHNTASLIPQARKQINLSLEKYGLIKPIIQPPMPQPAPNPVQPAPAPAAAQIIKLKKLNPNEPANTFAQRLVNANYQLILSLLFDTQASKFSVAPQNNFKAQQLIAHLALNIKEEYPGSDFASILQTAIQTSPRFGIITNFSGLARFISDTIKLPAQPAAAPASVQELAILKENIKNLIDTHFTTHKEIYKRDFSSKNKNDISEQVKTGFDEIYKQYGSTLAQLIRDGKKNEAQQCTDLIFDTFKSHLETLNTQLNAGLNIPTILASHILKFRAHINFFDSPAQPIPQPAPAPVQPAAPPAPQAQGNQPISLKIGNTTISIVQGDLLNQKVDAIVNAANDELNHAGGIAGKISNAAGPQMQAYCNSMPNYPGYTTKCPTGKAVITPSFNLAARGIKNIIHATGPRGSDANREQLLADAYTNSLKVAQQYGIKSIAFPAISTAIFAYPIDQATPIALAAIRDFVKQNPNAFTEIRLILLGSRDFSTYKNLQGELLK